MDAVIVYNPKGGVGKSMVCSTVYQYLLDHKTPFTAFDTDRNNPDCFRRYKNILPVKLAVFSEHHKYEDAANSIFNEAMQNLVVVNMPAQVHQPFKDWLEKNEILEIAPDVGVRFHLWFVVDSGFDSLQLLQKSLELFQNNMTWTVVRNFGRADDFDVLDKHQELQGLLKRYQATVIDFPALLGSVVRHRLDSESLPYSAALSRDDFGLIEKQRIRKFLREAYAAFETTEVFAHVHE
ncbi:hypothetical protein G7B40_040015 [Aetokthonos hydrillicola Thurmond2011]|jgi:hypothetical protein|uniref:Mobilization protein n=1 Tax=Aetokthonos hydrillicola Thurmond2011 TaxID=2712845 RepID=A0AAP5MDJ8_9CYAN|nr:hypothetical protein [Aetokthonos hydrillicola]MBW4590090.1 hypothetical protein [Aetokthonos hydrillicola CCALA 1050]MDR9900677.1 hypothetical protein [Aetokthonos hydrillicola Thurmond2011]